MFLMTLFSILCLLTAPIFPNPSIDIIHQNHLETTEGKSSFLTEKLELYAAKADQMNHEILDLAAQINALSPEEDQPQITALTQEVTQKMAKLLAMLPVLDMALSIDEDFQQIDAILQQEAPLSPEQQQIIDRIASLCSCMEELSIGNN